MLGSLPCQVEINIKLDHNFSLSGEGCTDGPLLSGGTPRKIGWGVQPASENPHPIYDLGFPLPYLWMHMQYAVVADVGSSVFAGVPFLLYPGHLGADQFLDEEKLVQQRAILLFATHLQQHFVVLKVAQQCHQMQMKCMISLAKGLVRKGIPLIKMVITLIYKMSWKNCFQN